MKSPRKFFVAASLLVVGLLCWQPTRGAEDKPAVGIPIERMPPRWPGMRVNMDIIVDGQTLRTINYQGKTYLPIPRLGTEYQIRVWNHGPHRLVAVLAVDGLSVLNGQPASEDQAGYIVAPHSDILIKGWRKNKDAVAAFSFQERDKSYASMVGRPENIGVIGLIAIEELTARPRPLPMDRRFGVPAPAKNEGAVGGTGTGYGRDIDSQIYYESFVRSSNKRSTTLYYDTVENLRKAGIPVDRPVPEPFPRDAEFVPPPPNFKGVR